MAKKKKSLAERMGLKTKKAPTPKEEESKRRYKIYKDIWHFLRYQIDNASAQYFRTGDTTELQKHLSGPALRAVTDELERMRQAGVTWSQPQRKERTSPELKVISEQLTSDNKPSRFVIEERFQDHSVLSSVGGGEKQGEGKERVIRGTVEVKGSEDYTLASVIRMKHATLES